jgi:hypothetical protein
MAKAPVHGAATGRPRLGFVLACSVPYMSEGGNGTVDTPGRAPPAPARSASTLAAASAWHRTRVPAIREMTYSAVRKLTRRSTAATTSLSGIVVLIS